MTSLSPEKAKDLYKKILKKDRLNIDAWQMLGTLSAQQGDINTAERCLLQAASLAPNRPELLYNIGYLYQCKGNLTDAARYYRRSLTLNPGLLEARYNLASVLHACERPDEAIAEYEKLIHQHPESEPILTGLASAHISLKNLDTAAGLAEKAIASNPASANAQCILGIALLGRHEYAKAAQAFKAAIDINKSLPEAYYGLGEAYFAEGQAEDAIINLREALRYRPDYPDALFKLGTLYKALARPELSIQYYLAYTKLQPADTKGYTELADACNMAGDWDKAIANHKKAISLDNNCTRSIAGLAHIYEKRQEYEQALELLRPELDREPAAIPVVTTYADVQRSLGNPSEAITILEHTLDTQEAGTPGIDALHAALGQLYDKLGSYDEAFRHYARTNEMRRHSQLYRYDNNRQRAYTDWCKTLFSMSSMAALPHASRKTDRPVFIVGMPRSGTTLLEQILSSHPNVHGAGELSHIYDFVDKLPGSLTDPNNRHFPASLEGLSQELVDKNAAFYLERLATYTNTSTRVIDKYPGNFLYLWMIELLFPEAHVLHCTRNPADTCLSIFFQNFTASQAYSTDLQSLGEYYREYVRLMEHWKNSLSLKILDVSYEALIQDTPGSLKAVTDFIGIPWDANCLKFHQNKRMVNTPSYHQVRRPIYKTSSGRWQHYRQHIGPLLDALGPLHSGNG